MKWLVYALLLWSPLCFAMYAGNAVAPDMPETGLIFASNQNTGLRVAYTYDHTFSKSIKYSAPSSTKWFDSANTRLQKDGMIISTTLGNQIELYACLGSIEFFPQGMLDHFDLFKKNKRGVYFGGGGNVVLVFFRQCTMGINAKYHTSSQIMYEKQSTTWFKGMLQNWQLSFTFGREFGWANPYVGFAFDSLKGNFHQSNSPSTTAIIMEELNPWVCVLGLGVVKNKLGYINIEGRLIGEFALGLRASLSF